MTSQVTGYIGKYKTQDGTTHSFGSTAYGYCQTAADTATKVVDMTGFTLTVGATIFVKFQYANSASSPKLSVNGSTAKNIYRYGTTKASTTAATNGWPAGAVLALTYDGTGWIEHYWTNTQYTVCAGYLSTAAETAEKTASLTYYTLKKGYVEITVRYANTAEEALTLNVNSTGALPIYINGEISSSTNCTLPGGTYLVYCDELAYYFRTDGKVEYLVEEAPSDSKQYVRKNSNWEEIKYGYDEITFTSNTTGINYNWDNDNNIIFDRTDFNYIPIYILSETTGNTLAATFNISSSTITYAADEKFSGTLFVMRKNN